MKSLRLVLPLAALLLLVRPGDVPAASEPSGAAQPVPARDTFHFTDVTLTDGDQVFERAEIYVRVKETSKGGYTRADYLDVNGRRLGFYEAFEVVSTEESALRAWAVRNFPDRTQG